MKDRVEQDKRNADHTGEFSQLTRYFVGADDSHHLADEFASGVPEFGEHRLLEVISFDDAVAGEGFVHDAVQVGNMTLYGSGRFANFVGVNSHRHKTEKQGSQ